MFHMSNVESYYKQIINLNSVAIKKLWAGKDQSNLNIRFRDDISIHLDYLFQATTNLLPKMPFGSSKS